MSTRVHVVDYSLLKICWSCTKIQNNYCKIVEGVDWAVSLIITRSWDQSYCMSSCPRGLFGWFQVLWIKLNRSQFYWNCKTLSNWLQLEFWSPILPQYIMSIIAEKYVKVACVCGILSHLCLQLKPWQFSWLNNWIWIIEITSFIYLYMRAYSKVRRDVFMTLYVTIIRMQLSNNGVCMCAIGNTYEWVYNIVCCMCICKSKAVCMAAFFE